MFCPRRSCGVILLAMISVSVAVDKSKFRTCESTPFCKRARTPWPEADLQGEYKLVPGSVSVAGDLQTVEAQLLHHDSRYTQPPKPLQLRLSILQHDIVRLEIDEIEPLHPRYRVQDVLEPAALSPAAAASSQGFAATPDSVSAVFGEGGRFRATLATGASSPFSLTVSIAGQAAIVVNEAELLRFEQYRAKNADGDTAAFPADADGMWSHTFGSHTDSMPRGPALVSADVSFPGASHVYGIPEHATSLALKSTRATEEGAAGAAGAAGDQLYEDPYRLFPLDVFEHDLDTPMALYGAIPFVLAHDADKTVGALWLNAAETFVDVWDAVHESSGNPMKRTHWFSESGVVDLFLLPGPTPARVLEQLARLTGAPQLPQRFATAYHQSRWNYRDEADVLDVNAKYDEVDIPVDVIWLDIEHTDAKKYFTWDPNHFPTPRRMLDAVAASGRKVVTIVDPHVKRDADYHVHKKALAEDLYVKTKDGAVYEGWCWPGASSYVDFLSAPIRAKWAELYRFDAYEGSTPALYTWNDMNEPSVFNGPEVTMPKDCVHAGGVEHRDVHALYGINYHRATFEGHLLRSDNRDRPFVLSRAFFAGSQRYGAIWTGDNMARWDHLQAATPMLLSHSLAGLPFIGADVGGFFGDPDEDLLVRWYQMAAYQPFFRAHAHIDTKRREPWLYSDATRMRIRTAVRTRYTLLPYVYTLFFRAHTSGMPMMRPLFFEFPRDAEVFAAEDSFLLGPALLVHPVTQAAQTQTRVYLPGAAPWYSVHGGERHAPQQTIAVTLRDDAVPVFQRGGSVVVRKERVRRSSALMDHDPVTLVVALDGDYRAAGEFYDDDGKSFEYEKGAFLHKNVVFDAFSLVWSTATADAGTHVTRSVVERVVIWGLDGVTVTAVKNDDGEDVAFDALQDKGHVVIRRPGLPVGGEWGLHLAVAK